MVLNQASLFLIFAIEGIIIGLIFDIFRILRKSFKTSDIVTYLEDILFWIITGTLILYSIFLFNDGEIRFFMFIAILLGTIFYMLLISQFVIKISVTIISVIKKIIGFILKIIIFPLKMIFRKPILFCIINIKKVLKQAKNSIRKINIKNYKKRSKKAKKIKNKGEKKNKSRIIK